MFFGKKDLELTNAEKYVGKNVVLRVIDATQVVPSYGNVGYYRETTQSHLVFGKCISAGNLSIGLEGDKWYEVGETVGMVRVIDIIKD